MSHQPSKLSLVVIGVFFLSVIFLWWSQSRFSSTTIELSGVTMEVLVAKTPGQLYKGLSGRESLEPYSGMLFLFPESRRQAMVMRDMRFSLDMVWLERGKVVDIAKNIPLEPNKNEEDLTRYYPRVEANMVIEFPAGWVDRHGLKIGDRLQVVE